MLELLQILHRQRVWITFGIALVVVLVGLIWVVSPRMIRIATILEVPYIAWGGVAIPIIEGKNLADIKELIRRKYAPRARPSSGKLPPARSVIVRFNPKARSVVIIEVVVEKGSEGLAREWLAGIIRGITRHWQELLQAQERAIDKLEHDFEETNTRLLRLIDTRIGNAGGGRSETMRNEVAEQQLMLMQIAEERRKTVFLRELAKVNLAIAEEKVDDLAITIEQSGRSRNLTVIGVGLTGFMFVFFSALYRDFWRRNRAAILRPQSESEESADM